MPGGFAGARGNQPRKRLWPTRSFAISRAVAKARTFVSHLISCLSQLVLLVILVAWNWRHFHARDGIVLAALVIELFVLKRFGRRKKREAEETKKLVDEMKSTTQNTSHGNVRKRRYPACIFYRSSLTSSSPHTWSGSREVRSTLRGAQAGCGQRRFAGAHPYLP